MTDRMLKAALAYGRLGWPVFPCRGKVPAIKGWADAASADADTIQALWRAHPGANIAVPTGAQSGVYVLDVDRRPGKDGWEALAGLDIPETPTAETGSGGTHVFFRRPDGDDWGNTAGKVGLGVDTRGDGGLVIVAPSVHPETGRAYRWEKSPAKFALAYPPEWLRDKTRPLETKSHAPVRLAPENPLTARSVRAAAYLRSMDPAIAGSGGHAQAWRAAMHMVKGFDLPVDIALDLLLAEYNPRCRPPWSEKELRHKVEQAAQQSQQSAGYLLDIDKPNELDRRIQKTRERSRITNTQWQQALGGIYDDGE